MSTKMKQLASVFITVAVYSVLVGWKVALLLAVSIGFHEYGHLWAAKRMGLQTKGFYLFPFMGGVALVNDTYKSYGQQAFVVLMGPLWGAFLAVVSFGVYCLTHQIFWLQAAGWMAFLNLFNLFPLSFLDGGQLMGTVTYSINKTLGMICHVISTLVAVFVLWHFNPVISVIIAIFGGASVTKEVTNWYFSHKGETWKVSDDYLNRPQKLSWYQMALTTSIWMITASGLTYMMAHILSMPGGNYTLLFK